MIKIKTFPINSWKHTRFPRFYFNYARIEMVVGNVPIFHIGLLPIGPPSCHQLDIIILGVGVSFEYHTKRTKLMVTKGD